MASHKALKSVVRSQAESFTSLMNYHGDDYVMGHIILAAWHTGATSLRVHLLTGDTDSSPLLTPEVRDSIARYVQLFPDLVRRSNSSLDFVSDAELVINVDPTERRGGFTNPFLSSPYTCEARIVDDRGKVYAHRISGWWYPEKNPPLPPKGG